MPTRRDIQRMADIAAEHFLQGRSKVEIAERHQISRFQVARLLEQARAEGILQIRVVNPLSSGAQQEKLAEQLGVSSVTVVTPRANETVRMALARQAARLLEDQLDDGMRVGVAWSRTLMYLPDYVQALPSVDVVQLVGSLSSPGASASSLIHALGAKGGGNVWPLPTPLVVGSAEVAASLRNSAEVSAALEAASSLDVAVVALGGWAEGISTLWSRGRISEHEEAEAAGVVAECCGILLNLEGEVTSASMQDRVVGVAPEHLRQAHVIAVAPAQGYPQAIIAAARAGLIDDVVMSEELAEQVAAELRRLEEVQ